MADQTFRKIEQISCEPHEDATMCTIRTTTPYGQASDRSRLFPVRRIRMEDMPHGGSAETDFASDTFNLIPQGEYECEYREYGQKLTCERT